MGYDDGECMACYCGYGGNCLVDNDAHYDVCLKCISGFTRGGGVSGRVISVLKNNDWSCDSFCQSCKKKGRVTIEISLCSAHIGRCSSSSSSSEEEEVHETEEEGYERMIAEEEAIRNGQ